MEPCVSCAKGKGRLSCWRMLFRRFSHTALLAIVIGTVLAYLLGQADAADIVSSTATWDSSCRCRSCLPGWVRLSLRSPGGSAGGHFAISIYNFVETMNNVEAMVCCGDNYNVQEAQLIDGLHRFRRFQMDGRRPGLVDPEWHRLPFASTFGIIGVLSAIILVPVIAPALSLSESP